MTIYECSLYDFDGFCQWYLRDGSEKFIMANDIGEARKKILQTYER